MTDGSLQDGGSQPRRRTGEVELDDGRGELVLGGEMFGERDDLDVVREGRPIGQ
ncbi:hypothetical protein [Streptomyces spiramyceticus]|uniref:hypothetical protein n=1 Tax=Streptomyces spiramyceticus TaxID=299717 RepID=UPI00237C48AC|nr:hypothetical protein [Streptomyces spiramyceticus]